MSGAHGLPETGVATLRRRGEKTSSD